MFVILKNRTHWRELPTFEESCRVARMDAWAHPKSEYTVWTKDETDKVSGDDKKPLYRVVDRTCYIVPRPPALTV